MINYGKLLNTKIFHVTVVKFVLWNSFLKKTVVLMINPKTMILMLKSFFVTHHNHHYHHTYTKLYSHLGGKNLPKKGKIFSYKKL